MKAAILVESRKPLVVDTIAPPDCLEYGQVLVRVVCSGICGSQIGEIDAVKGPDKFLPHLLGHEGGGVVEETGPGVRYVKRGAHVVLHWRKGAGIESPTPRYTWGDRTVNAGWVTTFNELAVVSENRLTAIPKDVDLEVAALMGCAVTTGFGVVNNDAAVKIGESVAVLGVGGVGLNVVQGSALAGAWPIVAVDKHQSKLDMAGRYGATHLVNAAVQDARDEILKAVGPQGADAVVDTTGVAALIELAYEVTSPRGRTILVGVPPVGQKACIYTLPLHFEKRLKGSHGGDADPARDIPRYVNLYRRGRLDLKGMITHRFSLDDVNLAVETMRRGEAGRCLITM